MRLSLLYRFILLLVILLSFQKDVRANWYKYSNLPVLSNGSLGSWNSRAVHAPCVLYDGSLFRMWYQGDEATRSEIGYATSIDGINWIPNQSYIIGYLDNNLNYNVHNADVIFNNNLYKMWFVGSDSTVNNIHINYSTSQNGYEWDTFTYNILTPEYEWETFEGKGVSFPRVVFNNNGYKIWYGAFGKYNGIVTWRIGYATSLNGLDWSKNPIPVLFADQDWENPPYGSVANPFVIYKDGLYHMYYHAAGGFGHATSQYGDSWDKDLSSPILTASTGNPTAFDSNGILDPYVVDVNGIQYMYYTGIDSQNHWQIGLATNVPLDSLTPIPTTTLIPNYSPTPTITPTSTPTFTPTWTPTITPTFTQTPTSTITPNPTEQPLFSPIIFIPGLGASWNAQAIFSCTLSENNNWQIAPYVSIYNRLTNTLINNAHLKLNTDYYIYAYDWRNSLDKQAENFQKYLNGILISKPKGTKFTIISHSLGGLIIRSYLEKYSGSSILKVLTIGTPHKGSILAYPLWENGEVWNDDNIQKIAINQLINHCRLFYSFANMRLPFKAYKSKKETLQQLSPSIQDLLPVFDILRDQGNLKDYLSLKYKNTWIIDHPIKDNLYEINFNTLSGTNISTIRYLNITPPSSADEKTGNWLDGKPISKEYVMQGDGTVLNLSSIVQNAKNDSIEGDHGKIMYSNSGIRYILEFLGLTTISPAQDVAVPEISSEKILIISSDQPVMMDISGLKTSSQSENGILVLYDPPQGKYNLKLTPLKSKNAYIHISLEQKNEENMEKYIQIEFTENKSISYTFEYKKGSLPDLIQNFK